MERRIKHAPNTILCRLRSHFPSGQLALCKYRESPSLSCAKSYCFYRISYMKPHCFPPLRNWGLRLTRNGGPPFGACLILSDVGQEERSKTSQGSMKTPIKVCRVGCRHWNLSAQTDLCDRERTLNHGRLIFIHHQCWEVLPFCRFQRQRCIKILCPKEPDFYTPLALKTAKRQHLPALVVYKNQSPTSEQSHFK